MDTVAEPMDGDAFGFFGLDDDDDDDADEEAVLGATDPTSLLVPSSQPDSEGPVATTLLPGGIEVSLDFGNELVSAPRLTKSLKMHYAKRSKKCDVKRLKHTLWQNVQARLADPSPYLPEDQVRVSAPVYGRG